MIEHVLWFFNSQAYATGLTPMFRAALICAVLYQLDLCAVLGFWLLRRLGVVERECRLPASQRNSALLVLPTLLREQSDLVGLQHAALSAAHNGYPAPLTIILCIDGRDERAELCDRLTRWAERVELPDGVQMYVASCAERAGKAVAMEAGVRFAESLVRRGVLAEMPQVFFNMDADSTLGERALERMAYHLQRRRWIRGTPHMVVTSNVVVPIEHCLTPRGGIQWIPLLVAREYLSSITYSKFNWKVFPCTCISGALYCTWTRVHLAAPYYAGFMQSLRARDWLGWWLGFGAPRFSQYRGAPLPEAMCGPGDDTWLAWLAATADWRDGEIQFDAPRTPLHAVGRLLLWYVSRPVTYDPLAKVFTKTPSKARALYKQRLRWNSSRVQDVKRWAMSHSYNWNVGLPIFVATFGLVLAVVLFVSGLVAIALDVPGVSSAMPFVVLLGCGYSATRVTTTLAALLVSESPPRDWLKLLALVPAGPYHMIFNTTTLCMGFIRDLVGFGEPTTFAPEVTLRRSNLTRFALAFRLRRACALALRAARHGDVPFGWFWFGWRESRWTPSGFDGWSSGKKPPVVYPREANARRTERSR